MSTVIQGFLVSFGLIVAIGAQNAFVLKQGLLKQHVFWVCLVCFLCDVALMSMGVLGLGQLIGKNQTAMLLLAIFGAVFLFWYGVRAFRSAYRGGAHLNTDDTDGTHSQATLQKTLSTTLALTLLNPHVYIDTLVLIGAVASPLTLTQKYQFLLGVLCASGLWFFGLGYGARLLIPLFKKARTWQILDALIGCVMWLISFGLVKYALGIST